MHGVVLLFFARPYPLGRGADVADDRLPALGDVDVLDGHLLLALRAVFLQGRHLRREGSRQLVEGSLGGILLGNILDMGQAPRECHRRHVDGRHLRGEHRLNLIAWFNSLDHGEHEIRRLFGRRAFPARVD